MPLPKPRSGEARDKFVSRCVSAVFDEGTLHGQSLDKDSEKDRMRAVAACNTAWRSSKKFFVFLDKIPPPEPAKSTTVVNDGVVIAPNPIKAVEGVPGRFKCYGVLFGEPDQRDAVNQYFTGNTQFHLDWYKSYPWLHHHGRHPKVGAEKVGTWDKFGVDDVGVFIEGEIDLHHKYKQAIETLIAEEILFPSSRAVPDLIRVEPDGRISEWPITEFSSTVAPAEYRMAPISPVAVSAIRSIEGGNMSNILEQLRDALAGVRSADVPTTPAVDVAPSADIKPEALTLDEVVSEVTKSLELDKFVKAVQLLDTTLKGFDARIGTIEAVITGLAKTEVEKIKALAASDDWYSKLWAASKSGDAAPAVPPTEPVKGTPAPAATVPGQVDETSVARAIFGRTDGGVQGVQ